jgi:hypothetical protein
MPNRTIPEIVTDLVAQFPVLVRQEARLARAEISEKVSRVGMGLAFLVVGAVLMMPALVVLLEAAVAILEASGFEPVAATLMAGGVTLLIGVILLIVGINRIRVSQLVPERTIRQIQEDASMVKQQVRPADEFQRAA